METKQVASVESSETEVTEEQVTLKYISHFGIRLICVVCGVQVLSRMHDMVKATSSNNPFYSTSLDYLYYIVIAFIVLSLIYYLYIIIRTERC
jgi:hypothetical protein